MQTIDDKNIFYININDLNKKFSRLFESCIFSIF